MLTKKTKTQRRMVRELAALAHERELAAALGALEGDFHQWRERTVDSFSLCDSIHAFHQGAARRLFAAYVDGDMDFAVASAIVRGVISESEAGPDVLCLLSGPIAIFRDPPFQVSAPPGGETVDRTEMLRRVEAHYRTYWRGPEANLDDEIAQDFVDESAPPGTPPGPEPIKKGSAVARAAFPDMVVMVEDSVVGGDVIAVRARWRGTHSGPFMGRPASGKTIENVGMVMWRFNAEGKIDRRWSQIDLVAVLKQLD